MTYLTQEKLGQRIADLRAKRGVSQRRLADVLDLDPSALSRIESGERGLAVGELVSGAEFLGVDPDALLRNEVDTTPLFRNEGGPGQGEAAVAEFTSIIDEFFTFEAAARS
ncbi:MAG: helix-turn-helix transcriptional regulator [Gaiellaceae bacterium]|jgi:transcriptional regulator with XRE-family HTH domain